MENFVTFDENGDKYEANNSSSDNKGNTKEIDTDSFEFEHKCPKCGFEWE
jgi:hypothetical protein